MTEPAELIERMLGMLPHINTESGVCCCGDDMERHPDPMSCGHSPVDSGGYAMDQWQADAERLIAIQEEPYILRWTPELIDAIEQSAKEHNPIMDDLKWIEASGSLTYSLTKPLPGVSNLTQNTPQGRNLYRLQKGGEKLCAALRKILDHCEDPMAKDVASKALSNREPDPKWSKVHLCSWNPISTLPEIEYTPILVTGTHYTHPEVVQWFAYDEETAAQAGAAGYWHYAEELLRNVADTPAHEEWSAWMLAPTIGGTP